MAWIPLEAEVVCVAGERERWQHSSSGFAGVVVHHRHIWVWTGEWRARLTCCTLEALSISPQTVDAHLRRRFACIAINHSCDGIVRILKARNMAQTPREPLYVWGTDVFLYSYTVCLALHRLALTKTACPPSFSLQLWLSSSVLLMVYSISYIIDYMY